MARSRTAFIAGTLTDNPLAIGATTMNSAGLASLPAIASPDIAVIILDPTGSAGAPEVVYVTAHTGSATSATITRASEGSTARQHASGIAWVHAPTTYDFAKIFGSNIASATTLTLPNSDHENSFVITGTTSIEGISRRPAGSIIRLQINTGPITFIYNTGTDPLLWPIAGDAGNIMGFTGEILTFVSNGTAWYLVGKSNAAIGWQVAGRYNGAEATTTSATPSDLVTISGLDIPVTYWVKITATIRRSAAADNAYMGLKINATVVSALMLTSGNTNEVQSGIVEMLIGPRATNYLRAVKANGEMSGASGTTSSSDMNALAADVPNAAITSIAIRAANGAGAMTVGIKDVLVEVLNNGG